MISLTVPGIVQLVTSVLINFIYVDILLTDLWLPQLFEKKEDEGKEMKGLNQYFEQNGFSTKVLINNMGSTFVYIAIYLFLIVLYILLTPVSRFFSSLNLVKDFISRQLFMKYTLILFFSQLPPMFLSGLINIYNVNFNGLLNTVSTVVSFLILIVLPLGLVTAYLLIRKSRQQGENKSFKEKFGELQSNDLKPNIVGSYWKVIVAIRWKVTLLIMVFLRDHFEIQIMSLLSISIFFQAILFGSMPMKNSTNQKMSIFNEIATSFYLYIVMLLTEFMGDTGLRDSIGWGLLILVGGVVGINLLRVLSNFTGFVKNIYLSLKMRFTRQKTSGKFTVPIKPGADPTLDYSTMNHSINLFSRNPRENEQNEIKNNDRVIMSTICQPKVFNQKEIVEEFKMPNFPQRIIQGNFIQERQRNNTIGINDFNPSYLKNTQFEITEKSSPDQYNKGVQYRNNLFKVGSFQKEKINDLTPSNASPQQLTSSPVIQWKSQIEENNLLVKVENESPSQSTSTPVIQWKSSIIINL